MAERGGDAADRRLPGHLQPSTHASLQTSWIFRLWQVVEQDLVHSLYCIPIGHLGTEFTHSLHQDKSLIKPSIQISADYLTALAFLWPAAKKHPMCMTCAGVLLQERTVAVFNIPLVTVAHLLLTEQQESLRRDQVGALQKHTGCLQHATARQNLQQNIDRKRESENFFPNSFSLVYFGCDVFCFFLQ